MKKSNLSAIAVLIFISVITKVFVLVAPFFIPHTGLDPYDYQYFFNAVQQFPHVYPGFAYPPLALVPMVIAYVASMGSQGLFGGTFQILMCMCDAATIACIYCRFTLCSFAPSCLFFTDKIRFVSSSIINVGDLFHSL